MSVHFALDAAMTDADWEAARRFAAAMNPIGTRRGGGTKSTGNEADLDQNRARSELELDAAATETEPETSAK